MRLLSRLRNRRAGLFFEGPSVCLSIRWSLGAHHVRCVNFSLCTRDLANARCRLLPNAPRADVGPESADTIKLNFIRCRSSTRATPFFEMHTARMSVYDRHRMSPDALRRSGISCRTAFAMRSAAVTSSETNSRKPKFGVSESQPLDAKIN